MIFHAQHFLNVSHYISIKVLTNNNVKDSIGGLGTAEFASSSIHVFHEYLSVS